MVLLIWLLTKLGRDISYLQGRTHGLKLIRLPHSLTGTEWTHILIEGARNADILFIRFTLDTLRSKKWKQKQNQEMLYN